MKIGTITEHFQDHYESDEIFSRLKQIGYDGVDYTLYKLQPAFSQSRQVWTGRCREVAAALGRSGMEAFQTHATYPTNFDGEKRLSDKCLDQFKREIEAAAIIGSPYIVIHPINIALYDRDKQADFEANMQLFGKLEPVLKQHGVKLGVENMFAWDNLRKRNCPTGCSTPEDMIKYIDNMNSDTFVACLDTGHMLLNCVDPADAVRALGSRLKLLHVHDNYALNDNHNAPGLGAADWHSFIKALKEIGYDGCFSMEISFGSVASIDRDLIWPYLRYAYAAAKKLTASL